MDGCYARLDTLSSATGRAERSRGFEKGDMAEFSCRFFKHGFSSDGTVFFFNDAVFFLLARCCSVTLWKYSLFW